MNLHLIIADVGDPIARRNFEEIKAKIERVDLLQGDFKFFEIEFTAAVTNLKYPHSLGFTPKDVIQTSLTGAGAITWNYTSFTATNLDITTTGACTVRAFIGRFH